MNKVSNCCGALPVGETHDDLGFCSKCKEGAVFESEEDNVQPITRVKDNHNTKSV